MFHSRIFSFDNYLHGIFPCRAKSQPVLSQKKSAVMQYHGRKKFLLLSLAPLHRKQQNVYLQRRIRTYKLGYPSDLSTGVAPLPSLLVKADGHCFAYRSGTVNEFHIVPVVKRQLFVNILILYYYTTQKATLLHYIFANFCNKKKATHIALPFYFVWLTKIIRRLLLLLRQLLEKRM